MNVLVDTSVWVAHFRHANPALVALLARDMVLGHPMVLAEIACGTPPAPRAQTLSNLALLGQAHLASWSEIMAFIERKKLYGLGCGFVDMALLASACITPDATLWTLDKKLMDLAKQCSVQFAPSMH
jgi:predicted nucleic acid-binding protein